MLEELRYLGFIFNKEGYKVDSRKTEIIRNFPRPQNTGDVRSFLGLANYCRKMIDRYADKAHALTKLLRHDCEVALGLRPSFYRRKPLLQLRYLLSFRLR